MILSSGVESTVLTVFILFLFVLAVLWAGFIIAVMRKR